MKILLFVFLLSLGHHAPPAHDVAIAMFRISQSEERLQLDVTLDIQDLAMDIGKTKEKINLADVQSYLNLHTQFEFNGKVNEIRLLDLKKVRDHFLLKAAFEKETKAIKNIYIHNTCLLNTPDHSNIIQVQIHGEVRDFRMHKERTSITVRYN